MVTKTIIGPVASRGNRASGGSMARPGKSTIPTHRMFNGFYPDYARHLGRRHRKIPLRYCVLCFESSTSRTVISTGRRGRWMAGVLWSVLASSSIVNAQNAAAPQTATAAPPNAPTFKVEVIETMPLPGLDLRLEQIPAPVHTAVSEDI